MAGLAGPEAQAVPIEGAGALAATAGLQLAALAATAALQRRAPLAAMAALEALERQAPGPAAAVRREERECFKRRLGLPNVVGPVGFFRRVADVQHGKRRLGRGRW